jgi:hypothetical protein
MISSYFPPIARETRHTVIECGGELGSLVLWGRTGADGTWAFQTVATDWSVCTLEDDGSARGGPMRQESAWVSSWAQALELLDERQWELLVPGTIHPEFQEATLAEVTRRLLGRNDERGWCLIKRWLTAGGARRAA